MTLPDNVSREELLELAKFEAQGVLDEVDCERLNRLFHGATPVLQAEIRAVQASLCAEEMLLASDEPDTRLRAMALTRVRDEIAAEQAALAPVATIGPRHAVAVTGVTNPEQTIEIFRLRAACESARGDLARWNRTAIMWRAASFVLGALLVVSLYYHFAVSSSAVRIGQLALEANARDELIKELGPLYRDFVDSSSMVRGLSAKQRGFSGAASVFVNRSQHQSLIIAHGLPQEIRFTVRLVADDGTITEVGPMMASSATTVLRVDGADLLHAFGRWEVVDASGAVILST